MIALATCDWMPDGFHEEPLRAALGAEWVIWDDPAVDWSRYERVVIRSTWDCVAKLDAYRGWLGRVADVVVNPVPVLSFSLDKRYLRELADAGLPVIPTRFVAPGSPAESWPEAEEVVVKPAVGSGSRGAGRFRAGDAAAISEHVAALHADGLTAMVQPYLASVDARGETALMYAAGAFTHAVSKGALLETGQVGAAPGLAADPPLARREPTASERRVAEETLAWVARRFGAMPAYARVDLVEDADGRPVVLELELVEPTLFLQHAPEAVAAFAAAFQL